VPGPGLDVFGDGALILMLRQKSQSLAKKFLTRTIFLLASAPNSVFFKEKDDVAVLLAHNVLLILSTPFRSSAARSKSGSSRLPSIRYSNMLYSPLEQFTLITILPIWFGNYYLSFTNSAFFMILSAGFFLGGLYMITLSGGFLIPSRWQSIAEMYYDFLASMVKEQVGDAGKKYFPFIFTIFTFVLLNNLIGLIPYSFTPTSHFIITMTLSCTIFIGVTIIGLLKHKLHFLSFFLPPGAPIALAPFLVIIEMVSYFFRAISLGVRLFANMLSGHCLVKILAGFAWSMIKMGGTIPSTAIPMIYASIPLIVVIIAVFFLEIGVSCLQAYVFTILTCIYFKDAIELH
jgi:ATP synthase subunit 6